MKDTNRADLLIAAGESIKMQEKAGIDPVMKMNEGEAFGDILTISKWKPAYDGTPKNYAFPLAVVEGRPVFVGDVLWNVPNNFYFTVARTSNIDSLPCLWNDGKMGTIGGWVSDMSWNPPQPKTVMVELWREDAEDILNCTRTQGQLHVAIRKALEK